MSIPLIPGGAYLFFGSFVEVFLGLLCLLLLVAAGVAFRRSKYFGSFLLSVAVFATLSLVAATLQAPSHVWPSVLAAYQQSPVEAKPSRQAELASIWKGRGHLSLVGWWRLSAKWGHCHELWPQRGCTIAPGVREAQGIARELLQDATREQLTTR